ncbi:MAG: 3-deoxy-manno-octulosonate cytidylyltransferase [Synergistaceae bacterium]|nr:3-deoxy-manno-octulosonate cytidylyltransferase [Synergistaceae bacterium]
MKKILGIIPARYASSRFPGKPLADIHGKPMIIHVLERAKMSKTLHDVIAATDDERIFDAVVSSGARAVMTDSNLPNGTARCEQALRIFGGEFDAVINIQGDEPMLDPIMIDEVSEILGNCECSTLCRALDDDFSNPNIVKVVMNQKGYALYFSRSLIPYKRNESNLPVYQHIGIYGYSVDFLKKYVRLSDTPLSSAESLEQLKILEHGYRIRISVTKSRRDNIGVDTPEDLERVRDLMNAEIRKGSDNK